MEKQCQKCGYIRKPIDTAPDWQCPSCGVVYAKVARAEPSRPRLENRDMRSSAVAGQLSFFRIHQHALTLLLVGVACFTAGYFSGRFHMQYQLTVAFSEAAGAFAKGMSDISAGIAWPKTEGKQPALQPSPAPPPIAPASRDQPVAATLIRKSFSPPDPAAGEYTGLIKMTVLFENKSEKPIRAFDGKMVFTDLLDNLLMNVSVAINEPLATSSSLSWDGVVKYNEFIDHHQRLRDAELANTKMRFVAEKALYSDGSVETF